MGLFYASQFVTIEEYSVSPNPSHDPHYPHLSHPSFPMKSFQYKAKNQQGQVLEGVIETQHFAEATSIIHARGLELISLEELKSHLEASMPYIFDAVDREGEPVQGTIQGTDEDVVKQKLEDEFGYEVSKVYRKSDPVTPLEVIAALPEQPEGPVSESVEEKKEESIIFQSAPRIIHSKPAIPEEELNEVHESIQLMLVEKGAAIHPETRERLLHLDGMIELIRENQNKDRWKALKKDIREAQKIAQREIQHYEDEKWKAYEQKNPAPGIQSYSDFHEKVTQFMKKDGYLSKVITWIQMVDLPNEHLENEVLAKQQYESVWTELQRFSGALVFFYLVFFFFSYYLKRSGVDDSLLVKIYDTTLFKQLIVGLFLGYAALTIRQEWLNRRIKTDAGLLLGVVAVFSIFFW